MKVSIVIPNYNGEIFLPDCLNALINQTFKDFEIILVDNGSNDDSIRTAIQIYPEIEIVALKENTGFAYAVNEGIKHAKGEYVILLNNDTIPFPNFVKNQYKMIKDKPELFSCSAMMIRNDNRKLIDDAGDYMCVLGWAFADGKDKPVRNYCVPHEVFASCAGAAIYRKAVFEKIGMFDNDFFAYLEDIDVGYRAKLHGYHNLYNPYARVYHIGSASSGSRYNKFKVYTSARNSMYLIRKNMPLWQIIINFPFLFAGVAVKMIFFAKKGLSKDYFKGITTGINPFKKIEKCEKINDFKACMSLQKWLIKGLFLRFSI